MGGFHGGVSHGGGGFHGGTSHSSGIHRSSSHRNYHSSYTYIHVGGNRGGYRGGSYNQANKYSLKTIIIQFIIAIIIFALTAIIFMNSFYISTKALVVDVDVHDDTRPYETYTFVYEAYGNDYFGDGEDYAKITFDSETHKRIIVSTVNVGEEYDIYYPIMNPSKYKFDNEVSGNSGAIVALVIGVIVGCAFASSGFKIRESRRKLLEKIGDLNGDGRIDDSDIEAYFNKKVSDNANLSENDNKPKKKKCPYCDSILDSTITTCPNCGANLANLDE